MELHVSEDPVTGAWRFTLDGHAIEVAPKHGFVKIDGTLHRVAAVRGLTEIEELSGAPLDAIAQLIGRHQKATRTQATEAVDREAPRPSTPRTPKQRRQPAPDVEPDTNSSKLQQTPDGALPTPDAARYLGVSPATLATLRTRGGGPPFVKLGRRVVYRREDLDQWLAERVRRSTSDPT